MAATFPTLTVGSPLNTIPSSTAPGTYDNLLSFPLPTIADADKVVFFGIDSYTYKEAFIDTAGREEINSLTSSGVISGMVISISGSNVDVSAGKYVVKDNPQGGDEAYTVIDFPGVTGFTLSNPSSLSYGFLNIDASQNITFDDMPKKRQSVCLGGLKVNGTTPLKIFNTGHRLANSTDQFEQFINDLGVFHKGITVSLDASGNLETDGGYVYTGSFYKGRLVQASQKLTFEKVNDEGTTDPEQDVLTLDELKKFYPPGGSETDLTGNNQYVIWYIFVTTDGLFLLLKPQKEINPPGQNAINDEDLYMTYEEAIKPEIVTSGATLVGCLIVNGNATALTDIINEDLVDNKLSSSGGRKTNTQTFSAPIPQLSDVEKAWEPPTGTYQLATDGTDYKIKKGLQGASQLPDGILCRSLGYPKAGLNTVSTSLTSSGSLIVPEVYYMLASHERKGVKISIANNNTVFTNFPGGNISSPNVSISVYSRAVDRQGVIGNFPQLLTDAGLPGSPTVEDFGLVQSSNDQNTKIVQHSGSVKYLAFIVSRDMVFPASPLNFISRPLRNFYAANPDKNNFITPAQYLTKRTDLNNQLVRGYFSNMNTWFISPLLYFRTDTGTACFGLKDFNTFTPPTTAKITEYMNTFSPNELLLYDQTREALVNAGDLTSFIGYKGSLAAVQRMQDRFIALFGSLNRASERYFKKDTDMSGLSELEQEYGYGGAVFIKIR